MHETLLAQEQRLSLAESYSVHFAMDAHIMTKPIMMIHHAAMTAMCNVYAPSICWPIILDMLH